MSDAPLTGVLLAAGRSRRMGQPKALLPWPGAGGETTIIAAAFDALAAMCDDVVVVLGHEPEATAAVLVDRRFTRIDGDPDAEMFDSVRRGLGAVEGDAALHLVDHPRIGAATRVALLDARRREPDRVLIPTVEGRGGHPVVIPFAFRTTVLSYDGGGGLRALWRTCPDSCRRIPVEDPWATVDLDTPEAYERARRATSENP